MEEVKIEEIRECFKNIGIACEKLQEEWIKITSSMTVSFSEAINALLSAMSGMIETINEFDYSQKKKYKKVLELNPTKYYLKDKRLKIYYCRNKL